MKVEIIFKKAAIAEVKEGAALIGKHKLPDNFTGPTFDGVKNVEWPGSTAFTVHLLTGESYTYNMQNIARIKTWS